MVQQGQQYLVAQASWRSDQAHLDGELWLPAARRARRHPAVIFIHGSGSETRDSMFYREHARRFAALGMATLLFDKRGSGRSTGDWRRSDFHDYANDVLAGLEWLRGRHDIDPARIGVVAVSQGGWVAPIVAVRDHGVSFMVMLSTAPLPYALQREYSLLEVTRDALGDDEFNSYEPEIRDHIRRVHNVCRTGNGWDALETESRRLRHRVWFSAVAGGRIRRDGWFAPWFRRVMDFHPLPLLRRIDIPLLAVYGDADRVVPPLESAARMAGLSRTGARDVTVNVLPNARHDLRTPWGRWLRGPHHWHPEYWPLVEDWLCSRAALESPAGSPDTRPAAA